MRWPLQSNTKLRLNCSTKAFESSEVMMSIAGKGCSRRTSKIQHRKTPTNIPFRVSFTSQNGKDHLTTYVSEVSLATVRLRYATEEANIAQGGGIAAHETSASAFILAGFEIEDLQCVTMFLIVY